MGGQLEHVILEIKVVRKQRTTKLVTRKQPIMLGWLALFIKVSWKKTPHNCDITIDEI